MGKKKSKKRNTTAPPAPEVEKTQKKTKPERSALPPQKVSANTILPSKKASARPLSFAIAFWGLSALLFFSPFFRGLFFPEDQYRALILIAIVFWFVWLGKQALQENNFFEHPLDYLMLGLPLVYIYSAFFAVNTGYAVNEIARNTMYFLAFWVAARVVTSTTDAIRLFHIIYFSAILVALAGLATATGIISIKDGFLAGRLYSSFQYPNALATYLSAVFLLGLYLWNRAIEEGPKLKEKGLGLQKAPSWFQELNLYPYYYVLGNLLLFAVFLGTKSQGGFLTFALVFPLLLIKLQSAVRIRVIVHTLFIALPAFLVSNRFLAEVAADRNELAWLWVFAGLFLVLALQVVVDLARRRGFLDLGEKSDVAVKALGGLAGLAVVVGAIIVATSSALQERLAELIKWHSAEHRFAFMGDAWDMIIARPLTGWGGGGWKEAYQAFQSYLYTSREVHGHYFQVGVETGVLGVLILVGIWAAFLWAAHRLFHAPGTRQKVKDITWIVTMVVILIGLHAAIDFDLSLSALTLVLFALFGSIVGLSRPAEESEEGKRVKRKNSSYVPPNYTRFVLASVGAVVVIIFAGCLAASHSIMGQAVGLLQAGNYKQGVATLKRAEAYNPTNGEISFMLAQVYQGTGDKEKALDEMEKALTRSKYNASYYVQKASIHLSRNEYDEALKNAEQAVTVAPLVRNNYERLTQVAFAAGFGALETDDVEAARGYFSQTIIVPTRMDERMSALSEDQVKWWQGAKLTPTAEMMLPLGTAHYFLNNFEEAVEKLESAAQNDSLKGEALLWLALISDRLGEAEEAESLLEQLGEINPELRVAFEGLRELPLP